MVPSFCNGWRPGGFWRRRGKSSDPALLDAHADSRTKLFIALANWLAVGLVACVLSPNLLNSWRCFGTTLPVDRLPLVVFAGCLMPPVLARLCYSLIDHRVERQPIEVEIPVGLAPRARERVGLTWAYEKQRAGWSLSRAGLFANLWGLTGTLTLLGGVVLSLPFLEGTPIAKSFRACVAFAITGAAGTRFLFDLAKICVRTGTDDASKRMFSEAVRGLLFAVLVAGAVVSLAPVLGLEGLAIEHPERAAGLGAAVAILGASSMAHLQQRLAVAFGLGRVEPANLTPISAIAGCSPAEIERLRDEGIESVEALVNTPVPRLFLATRFSLQRICDWMDRGLLLCWLGASCAADLQSKTGIVGVRSLRHLCSRAPDRAAAVLVQAMRLANRSEASILMQKLADDDGITLLDAFSQALPRLGADRLSTPAMGSQTNPNAARAQKNTVQGAVVPPQRSASNGSSGHSSGARQAPLPVT